MKKSPWRAMNICVVNTFFPPHVSGTARASFLLARKLSEAGHNMTVIASSIDGSPRVERTEGMTIYRLRSLKYPKLEVLHNADLYYSLLPPNLAGILRILRKHNVEVVHVWGQFFDLTFMCMFAAKILRLPVVLTIGTRMEHPRLLYNSLFRVFDRTTVKFLVGRRADRVIAMDKLMKDYILDRYDTKENAIRFIPAGVDLKRFRTASGEQVRREYGLGKGIPVILSLGTMSNLRSANGLLTALPNVLKRFRNAKLLIVGSLYDKKPIELIRKLELGRAVIFCGRVDYDRVPSFLSASQMEGHDLDTGLGIGLASLEAMAAGKPVLTSAREDNFIDLKLRNWGNIVLVKPGDAESISDAVLRLLSDRKLRERIGRNAKKFVNEHFSLDAVYREYQAVYEELLSQHH